VRLTGRFCLDQFVTVRSGRMVDGRPQGKLCLVNCKALDLCPIPRGFLHVTHDLAAAEAMNSVEYLRPRINTVYYVLAMSNEYLFHITPRTI
jgi:hypothetical protein